MGDRMMGTSRHGLRITGAFAAVMGAVVLLSGFGRAFAQQPTSQVEIRAAFWRVGGGFETSLLINNTQPQQISVQVVVYAATTVSISRSGVSRSKTLVIE